MKARQGHILKTDCAGLSSCIIPCQVHDVSKASGLHYTLNHRPTYYVSLVYALYKQEQWHRQSYGITAKYSVQKDAIQNDTMQKDTKQRDDTQNDAMPSMPVGKLNSVCTSELSKIGTLPAEAQRYYVLAPFTYGAMQTRQSTARTKCQHCIGQCTQHQCCQDLLVEDITNNVITWLSANPMLLGPHLLLVPSPAASSIKAC